jgi:hypothetical protein
MIANCPAEGQCPFEVTREDVCDALWFWLTAPVYVKLSYPQTTKIKECNELLCLNLDPLIKKHGCRTSLDTSS